MNTDYVYLSEASKVRILEQRIFDLEADHWRYRLDLEEAPPGADTTAAVARIVDVERRIDLHGRALNAMVGPPEPDAAPEKLPEFGS